MKVYFTQAKVDLHFDLLFIISSNEFKDTLKYCGILQIMRLLASLSSQSQARFFPLFYIFVLGISIIPVSLPIYFIFNVILPIEKMFNLS